MGKNDQKTKRRTSKNHQGRKLFHRPPGKLLVSTRNFDLVSMSTSPITQAGTKTGALYSVPKAFWEVHGKIFEQLTIRCPRVIDLHEKSVEQGEVVEIRPWAWSFDHEGVAQCHFDVKTYIKLLREKRKTAPYYEQRLIDHRIAELRKCWSYPRRSMPCVLRADSRDQVLTLAMGKADFYCLMWSHHPYWASIYRMMMASKPEVMGLLSIPAQRIKITREQIEKKAVSITSPSCREWIKGWEALRRKWLEAVDAINKAKDDEADAETLYQLHLKQEKRYAALAKAEREKTEVAFSPDERRTHIQEVSRVKFLSDQPGAVRRPLVLFTLIRPSRQWVYSLAGLRNAWLKWLIRYVSWRMTHRLKPWDDQEVDIRAVISPYQAEQKLAKKVYEGLVKIIEKDFDAEFSKQVRRRGWEKRWETEWKQRRFRDRRPPLPPLLAKDFFLRLTERLGGNRETGGKGAWFKRGKGKEPEYDPEDIRLEMFLTQSDLYPIFIKTQFASAPELFDFWKWLRRKASEDPKLAAIDTASLLGFGGDLSPVQNRVRPAFGDGGNKAEHYLLPDDVHWWILDNKANLRSKLKVSLLIKLTGGEPREVALALRMQIAKALGLKVYNVDAQGSLLGFWDLEFVVQTRNLGKLFLLAESLRHHPHVANTSLRPRDAQRSRLSEISPSVGRGRITELRIEDNDLELRLNQFLERQRVVPQPGEQEDDSTPLRVALHNLKMDVEWNFAYLTQLKDNWKGWDLSAYHRTDELPETFDILTKKLDDLLARLTKLSSQISVLSQNSMLGRSREEVRRAIDGWRSDEEPANVSNLTQLINDTLAENSSTDGKAMPTERLAVVERAAENSLGNGAATESSGIGKDTVENALWEIITAIRGEIRDPGGVHSQLSLASARFKEEGEVVQAVTMTEPFFKVGEQSGIMTVSLLAANRLFRDYCAAVIKREPETFRWHGLITAGSGGDFVIHPKYNALELPVDFKFHTIEKLTPIAHEAVHLIFHDKRKTLKFKNWMNLVRQATSLFHLVCFPMYLWNNLGENEKKKMTLGELGKMTQLFNERGWPRGLSGEKDYQECLAKVYSQLRHLGYGDDTELERGWASAIERLMIASVVGRNRLKSNRSMLSDAVIKRVSEYQWGFLGKYPELRIAREGLENLLRDRQPEILVDIVAMIAAGPAYPASMIRYLYESVASEKYPPAWIRMAILAEAARHLGWTWAEENVWYDPWEIWEKIRINTERKSPGDFFRRGAREGLPTLSNQVENFRATLAWIRTNFLDDASTFKAILIWWAVAGRRDLIRGIEAVSDGIGKRFNFYPPLARKKMPGQNRRDLMRRIIRATDQYCWTQAERMVYGCEVVMDCPPKIIAAAATLPICCQPYFPTGRILMSVRYTDGGWDPYLRYLKGSFAREPEVWETVRRNLQEYWTPSRVSRGNSATPRRKQNNASKSR